MPELAAFAVLWTSLAAYAVLAGADFGIGLWILASSASKQTTKVREDVLGYFSPLWEVNTLFLIFFLMGLLTVFPSAVAVLGQALLPLLLIALVLFVIRAVTYAMLHYGPKQHRGWTTPIFATSSLAAGAALGFAAAAPASGAIGSDGMNPDYYFSAVGLAAVPLSLAASAHLAAVMLVAYARAHRSDSQEWFRLGALISGIIASGAAVLFTAALTGQNEYLRDRLLGAHALPLLAAGIFVVAGLVSIARRRYASAVALTAVGYATGLIGGAFALAPYLTYPTLEISEAASADNVIVAYLIATAIGAPLLIAALAIMYRTVLAPTAANYEEQHPDVRTARTPTR